MKKKQPTVADVLHYAADKCLVAHSRYGESGYEKFSCIAVSDAVFRLTGECHKQTSELSVRVLEGLDNMGCNTGSFRLFTKYGDHPHEFSEVNHKVQGMRYMWLKWAALMAEEQGV